MVFLFRLNAVVGTCFMVIVGFMMGVRGLFMRANLTDGFQEKAGFCFRCICFGRGVSGNKMW